ncbi:Pirin-like protein [Marinobacter lipolyticus SM19]|uniref:Pirin-like protein n=1 Tax=Marinobacter lipolyticus SM19 TaxID=1318628 RepID=R8B1U3_9GAMM|nr:pirin family protein [Marinobacter lipolyticus]EON92542.1 Pirin-like protein [Marinobacter lipolyticus SM19]
MKQILTTYSTPNGHWVGDGFPVRSLLSYDRMGANNISPFLLLDYAGPAQFQPGTHRRGVGQHPHRGFETVTLVLQGELEHRDSTGSGGLIGEGDVQWMTAGAGIVHEEFHSGEFTERGGVLEMVQLWVNLPARAKDVPAAYQTLLNKDIPDISLGDYVGSLRVIAGEYQGHMGPAKTHTPMNVWDLKLEPGADVVLTAPEGHTAIVVVLKGTVQSNGSEVLREAEVACFERQGQELQFESNNDARLLVLTGEPINEPVVGHGPFVMNSEAEIHQAIADFQNGKFGILHR